MTNDLMLEVEDSIRQEKLDAFWKEYGSTIIAAIILTILFTAASSIYREYKQRVNEQATVTILDAIRSEEPAENLNALQIASGNHQAIAALASAGQFLEDGDLDAAYKGYEMLSLNDDVPPLYRDLAKYLSVKTAFAIDSKDFDKIKFVSLLDSLISDPNNPWRYHASMQKAVIQVSLDHNYEAARQSLKLVKDAEDVPFSLKQRVTALDHVYAIEAAKSAKPEEKTKTKKVDVKKKADTVPPLKKVESK